MKDVSCNQGKQMGPGLHVAVAMRFVVALAGAGLVFTSQTARPAGLVAGSISFGGTVTFDSFDSGDTNYSTGGLYDPAKSRDTGDVFTTGAEFSLGGHSWIMGHVRTGPGGNVVTTGWSSIGSKSWVQGANRGIQPGWFTNDWAIVLPDVAPPGEGSYLPVDPGSYTINGTTYQYAFFGSGDYSVASLTGNVYIGPNAHVRLLVTQSASPGAVDLAPQGASLVIYVAGPSITFTGPVNSTGSQKAANLNLLGLPTCLSIGSGPRFTGTIYAPQADLQMGSATFVGAAITKSATASGSLAFHYDEQLGMTPPSFVTQPQSQAVRAGQGAQFSVIATSKAPYSLEWLFNGKVVVSGSDYRLGITNVAGQFECLLIITNAAARHAGSYCAVVGNTWGSQTSSNAVLTVIGDPPSILGQPVSQAVLPGSNAVLRVSAASSEPLAYQWNFNGSHMPAATNSALMLSGVQPGNVGSYSAVVTNAFGSVTSSPAELSLATPPAFLWARGASNGAYGPYYGSYAGSSVALGIAADAVGNLFIAGWSDAATLDLGGTVLTNTGANAGMEFICKYDAWGNLLWSRQAATNALSGLLPLRVAADAFGNAFLVGRFQGTANFGTNTLICGGPADLFVAKYAPQGQAIWARRIGAYDANYWDPFGLALDIAGNTFVAGKDSGTADFGSVTLTNSAGFLAKYDPAGTLLWAKEALPANAIAAGTNGAVYLAGGPGLLAKYDEQGNLAWSRTFPYGEAITVDGQENIFITGYGDGTYDGLTLTNSGGFPDFFVARCNPAGQLVWLRQAGGIQQERGSSITLDGLGNVYVAGASGRGLVEPRLSFGPTVLTNSYTFVAKYDAAGNPLWAAAPVATNRVAIFGIALTDPADVYVAGNFSASSGSFSGCNSSSACFDSFSLLNAGPSCSELFVAKLAGLDPQSSVPAPAVLAGLRCPNGGPFQFSINGTPGLAYVVEASSDLGTWHTLVTNTLPFLFVDETTTNFPQRFYRAVSRP